MTLKDVTQLVHARLIYHAQKAQLTFKWRIFYVTAPVTSVLMARESYVNRPNTKKMDPTTRKGTF